MSRNKYIIVSFHAFIWLLYLSIPLLINGLGMGKLEGQFLFNFYFNLIINALNFYFFYLVLIPKVLAKRRFVRFIIYSLLFTITYAYVNNFLMKYGNIVFYGEALHKQYFSFPKLFGTLFQNAFFAFLATFIRFAIDWFKNIYQQEQLKRQSLASELNMLRLQISPHFLMNALNNIYSLVLKKSDDAADALLKLSDIMRYMLYETNTEKIIISKELIYVRSYIDIQKLRIKKPSFAHINEEDINYNFEIAPLLLIPFIENAFKHGDRTLEKDCIFIKICIENNNLNFEIRNKIAKTQLNKDNEGGIGLENVKRRLELLYPNKHRLDIERVENEFIVDLKIDLL